ncbi:Cbx3 [Aphelenchoides bicaudatus]|nr:Cbx3 [Aphelenchoides bicaudatus]
MPKSKSTQQYSVEKILNRRFRDGDAQYLIKWEGFDEPTWEPLENCSCDALIREYDKKHPIKQKSDPSHEKSSSSEKAHSPPKKQKTANGQASSGPKTPPKMTKNGSYRAEKERIRKVVGCKNVDGNLMILCEFRNSDDVEATPYEVVCTYAPRALLDYWKERVIYTSDNKDG